MSRRRGRSLPLGAVNSATCQASAPEAAAQEPVAMNPDLVMQLVLPFVERDSLCALMCASKSMAQLVLLHSTGSKLTLQGRTTRQQIQLLTTLPSPEQLVFRGCGFTWGDYRWQMWACRFAVCLHFSTCLGPSMRPWVAAVSGSLWIAIGWFPARGMLSPAMVRCLRTAHHLAGLASSSIAISPMGLYSSLSFVAAALTLWRFVQTSSLCVYASTGLLETWADMITAQPARRLAVRSLECTGCTPQELCLSLSLSLVDPARLQHVSVDDASVCQHLSRMTALQSIEIRKQHLSASYWRRLGCNWVPVPLVFGPWRAQVDVVNEERFKALLAHPTLREVALDRCSGFHDHYKDACHWDELRLKGPHMSTIAQLPRNDIGRCVIRGCLHWDTADKVDIARFKLRPNMVLEPTQERRSRCVSLDEPSFVLRQTVSRIAPEDEVYVGVAVSLCAERLQGGVLVLQGFRYSVHMTAGLGYASPAVTAVAFAMCEDVPEPDKLFSPGILPDHIVRIFIKPSMSAQPTAYNRE